MQDTPCFLSCCLNLFQIDKFNKHEQSDKIIYFEHLEPFLGVLIADFLCKKVNNLLNIFYSACGFLYLKFKSFCPVSSFEIISLRTRKLVGYLIQFY